jgi:hypothetical protein
VSNNHPFPAMSTLHHSITSLGRLVAGRDGGPSVEVAPDSIHRSILLVEDMIGSLIPTRVEDNPISGRVMMRWVRPWGEFLLEVPAHRDRYVYHIYPYTGISTEGEVVTITALHELLWQFLLGPHTTQGGCL